MRKRFLSLCLVFLMAVSVLSGVEFGMTVKAEEVTEYYDSVSGLNYVINDEGTITITGCDISKEEIIIPEQIDGMTVTEIAGGTFVSESDGMGNYYVYFVKESNIKKVVIPKTVKNIEGTSFTYCYLLEEIVVDASNEYYCSEDGVLFNKSKTTLLRFPCKSGIENYVVPDSVTSIEDSSFAYCTNLKYIEGLNNLTVIPFWAFVRCTDLESIVLPEGIEKIEQEAFAMCSSLKNISLPDSLEYIEYTVFNHCNSITNIAIPKNVYHIGTFAFTCCDSLESISVDENNEYYSDVDGVLFSKDKTVLYQYPGGRESSNYIIPDSVESIDDYAFRDVTALEGITLPEKFTMNDYWYYWEISSLFYGCSNLKNVYVSENNNEFADIDGVVFTKDKTELLFYPNKHAEEYSIPLGVEVCLSLSSDILKKLIITENVQEVSTEELSMCTNLEEIIVEDNNDYFTDIEGVLFSKDKKTLLKLPSSYKLSDYIIPDDVIETSDYAFSNCITLQNISVSKYITNIGATYGAYFEGCIKLNNIYIDDQNANYADIDGVLFSKDGAVLYRYPAGRDSEKYIVPCGTNEIERCSFEGCIYIKEIKVSAKVGGAAFWGCENLETIWLSDSVNELGNNALAWCSNLKNVIILNSECEISDYAIYQSDCPNAVIYGYTDSTAQEFADNTGFKFVSIQCEDNVHVWNEYATVEREATCNSSGWQSVRCMICDSMQDSSQSTIPALGHDVVDGTCTRCGQGPLLYDAYEGAAYIYGYIGDEIDVVIPEEIDGNKVTTIILEGKGLEWTLEIRSFTIPATVNYIDKKEYWNVDFDLEVIYGYTGSYAETYANENGITFIALDENISGDVDDNGEVNLKDYARLLRYVAGWDVEVDTHNADVNGDGNVNLKDYVLIQRYVAGWDVELS